MCCVVLEQVSNRGEAHLELNAFRRKHDCALVISGDSLEVLHHTVTFLCTADDAEDANTHKLYFTAKTNTSTKAYRSFEVKHQILNIYKQTGTNHLYAENITTCKMILK